MELPSAAFATPASRAAVSDILADHVRAIPGVSLASWSYGTPPGGPTCSWSGPAFFALHGVQVLRGRPFGPSDDQAAVLVSDRSARAIWPGLEPVGRAFTYDGAQHRVIGLVKETLALSVTRFISLDQARLSAQARC